VFERLTRRASINQRPLITLDPIEVFSRSLEYCISSLIEKIALPTREMHVSLFREEASRRVEFGMTLAIRY